MSPSLPAVRAAARAATLALALAVVPDLAAARPADLDDHVFHPPVGPAAGDTPALPPLRRLAPGGGFQAVPARAELPDPRPPAAGGALARLVGRRDGHDVLAFPLAHTRVSARVVGNVARVEVMQRFDNPSDERLEAVYAFPLPENAAVTGMTFQIGRRVVQAEVRRREEARAVYQQARRTGHTAALTEQERPNLFTQSVANVPPHESVFVVLRYVHEVPFRDGRYGFVFPTAIGPRYLPAAGVADAARVVPPVAPAGTRPAHDLELLVQLLPGDAFADVAARSHRIVTGLDGAGARLVALAEDDRVPDKDFVLSWRPAAVEPEARALLERERDGDFLLLLVQPPAEVSPAQVRPREVVFLLDKSGSMMGRPIETAKALIVRALRALGPGDTFQLLAFDGSTEAMTPGPLSSAPGNVAAAERWLAGLQGGGGTEMLAGFRAALHAPADPARLRLLVFCTDGFIGNEAAVIEAVERERGEARVFGFGIGSSVNRYLVEGVARAGRGVAEVVGPRDPVDGAVERLFARLDRPVLTDLELSFEGGTVTDLAPARLPDLFAGQPLVVSGRLAGAAPRAAVLRGKLGAEPWSRRVSVTPATGDPRDAPVAGTLWARRRIEELLHRRPTAPAPAEVDEVVALALRFGLVTPYTALVAVERELLVDPRLALVAVAVPGALPEGVAREGIFGPAQVQVLPARVKPGDPELWIAGAPDVRSVQVKLPFEASWREAVRDGERWVVRFLVPPGAKDGSYQAAVRLRHADGREERQEATIRVDTSAAAVAVLSGSGPVRPGERLSLRLRPALPLGRLPALVGRPGGLVAALGGEMELKEILVRGPWGDPVPARQEGRLGTWQVELPVPADARPGQATLEIVASDAAGNVSRRTLEVAVMEPGAPLDGFPPVAAVVAGLVLLDLAAVAMALLLLWPALRRPRAAALAAARPGRGP